MRRSVRWTRVVAMCAVLAVGACAEGEKSNPEPVAAAPQPAEAQLRPGLAVRYYGLDLEDISALQRAASPRGGSAGAPLPGLDYPNSSGPVLTSGAKIGIGADITGFIRFPASGRYLVAANANDGVRIYVGGTRVSDDPGAHPDQISPPGEIAVEGGVWYPLRVLYFQRRGTWALQLMWAPAGQKLSVVPASALARAEE